MIASTRGPLAPTRAHVACRRSAHAMPTRRALASLPKPIKPTKMRSADASTVSTEETKSDTTAARTVEEYVQILHQAAEDSSVSGKEVLDAMIGIERLKVKPDRWPEVIFDPAARWKLLFTAKSQDVVTAGKGQGNKGGLYVPVPAAQKFTDGVFTNGVFLWGIGHLTFQGPYKMVGRKMDFDVVELTVGLGPWSFTVPLKKGSPLTEVVGTISSNDKDVLTTKLPFFLYCYADDKIKVARGRSGGLAMWKKADSEWQASSGVLRVYK